MNYRMYKTCLLAILLASGALVYGDTLNQQHVSPNAKWLVHVDCDNLRQTQIGGFLFNQFLVPKVAEATSDFKFNVTNVLQRISSLTAYGSDFKKGPDANAVLLINSDADTQKALEGVLVAQILADTNGPVKKLESSGPAIYSVANQVFVSPQKGGPIVISKSESQIETARGLLAGKGPKTPSKPFGAFPGVSNSFFFVGIADALNVAPIPAQAKVLQMADGGRVAVGERNAQTFVDLALRGKTAEVTLQIQQVVEGMVALVSLGQPDNVDLMNLAKSIKVSSTDQLITINLEYPSEKVIAKLNDELKPKAKKDKAKRDKTRNKKQKPAAEPEDLQPEDEDEAKDGAN